MAVALIGTQQTGFISPANPSTATLTVPAGNSSVVVQILNKSTGSMGDGNPTVTLAGDSPAGLVSHTFPLATHLLKATIAVFHGVASGSRTLSVTLGSAPSGASAGTRWAASYLTGTNTSHVWDDPASGGTADNRKGGGTGTALSTSAVETFTDGMMFACAAHEGASVMTAKGTGQTGAGGDADGFVDEGNWNSAFTYETTSANSTDTPTFTNGASDTWAMVGLSISPGAALVNATRAIRYDVRNAVSGSRAVKYDVRNVVAATRAVKYDVRNAVNASRAVLYDIVARVQAPRAVRYDIRGLVAATRAVRYDVRNPVSGTRQVRYDIRNFLSAIRAVRYDIAGLVSATCRVVYDIAAQAAQQTGRAFGRKQRGVRLRSQDDH